MMSSDPSRSYNSLCLVYMYQWLYNLDSKHPFFHVARCPCRRFAKIAKSRIRPPSWWKVPRNLPPSFPPHPVRSGSSLHRDVNKRRSLPVKYCMILYAFNSAEHSTTVMIRYDAYHKDICWRSFKILNIFRWGQFNTTLGKPLDGLGVLHTVRLDTLHDANRLQDQFYLKQAWNQRCTERKKTHLLINSWKISPTWKHFKASIHRKSTKFDHSILRLHHSNIILCAVINGCLLSDSR